MSTQPTDLPTEDHDQNTPEQSTAHPPQPSACFVDYIDWLIGSPNPLPPLPKIPATIMTSVKNPAKTRYALTLDHPHTLAQLITQIDLLPANWWKYTLKALHKIYPDDQNTPEQRLQILEPFLHLDFVVTKSSKRHPTVVYLKLPSTVVVTRNQDTLKIVIPTLNFTPVQKTLAALTHDAALECPFGSTTRFHYDGFNYTIWYKQPEDSQVQPATYFLRSACQILPRLFRERSPVRRFIL